MEPKLGSFVRSVLGPSGSGARLARWQPPVDIYQTARGWLVKYELAGVRPDEIQLRIRGRVLVLSGARRDYRIEDTQRSYSMEIAYNRFERTIELPCDLEKMHVTTDYRDGMLLVHLNSNLEAPEDEC
jgi:HSP20 family protein